MKNRWSTTLNVAAANHDTTMPWARGATRKAMILRRQARDLEEKEATQTENNA